MGDLSAEPSMEEILSSIKRIIAEEGEAAPATRLRKPRAAPAPEPAPRASNEDVLELNEPVLPPPEPAAAAPQPRQPAPAAPAPEPRAPAASILSERTADVTRGALEALSRLVVKPDVAGSDTLEGMVREMLRPMLREWLDANLPAMVETMVAREIKRISELSR